MEFLPLYTDYSYRNISQKDSGYAWVILLAGCVLRLINVNGVGMMGVLIVELGKTFDATPVEINVISTTLNSVTFGGCKCDL